jgi:hypothetical protein
MVIGLRYGRITAQDKTAKEKTYAVVGEFLKQFKQRNGSVECTRLLGYNLSDPQQVAEAKKNKAVMGTMSGVCPGCVEFLEKLI